MSKQDINPALIVLAVSVIVLGFGLLGQLWVMQLKDRSEQTQIKIDLLKTQIELLDLKMELTDEQMDSD